jgi:putative hemolysin
MQIAEISPPIHSPVHLTASRREKPNLSVSLAQTQEEILASLRLRYQVFAGEMGARLHCAEPGVDRDEFDAYCNHLIVKDSASGEVVASTRILTGSQAKKLGRFYSETEFDLGKIRALRGKIMEIGRTCVHPDYRGGAAISVLWNGLAQFMVANRFDYLIGCASIPAAPGLRQMLDSLAEKHLSDEKLRVLPRSPLPAYLLENAGNAALPPLLKAYARLGAQVCGEPCWDEDFQVADVFILLDRKVLDSRYARHFVDRADAASSLASFKLRRFHGPRQPAGDPSWLRRISRRLATPFRSGQAAPG